MTVPPSRGHPNVDPRVVAGFGEEWATFDQDGVDEAELAATFDRYFSLFPWERLSTESEGFDLGCGSGRWAAFVAPRVGVLHCIDPSSRALDVARRRLEHFGNCKLHLATADSLPLTDNSMDFGYSLGVLHHIPDPQQGLTDCVRRLKAGAPFLVYLYYALENRPKWYRWIWRAADQGRRMLSRLPWRPKLWITTVVAAIVYWPAARMSRYFEHLGFKVESFPLSFYRDKSFYTMRTDAFDRFGTRIEHRFTAPEIEAMMRSAGLTNISFRDEAPYWCALGYRAGA